MNNMYHGLCNFYKPPLFEPRLLCTTKIATNLFFGDLTKLFLHIDNNIKIDTISLPLHLLLLVFISIPCLASRIVNLSYMFFMHVPNANLFYNILTQSHVVALIDKNSFKKRKRRNVEHLRSTTKHVKVNKAPISIVPLCYVDDASTSPQRASNTKSSSSNAIMQTALKFKTIKSSTDNIFKLCDKSIHFSFCDEICELKMLIMD